MAPSKSSAGPAGETGVPEPGDGIDYRRILGPLDGSALAEQALPVAVWLAIVPVFPYFFADGQTALTFSVIFGVAALFFIGAPITVVTGRSALKSGLRQVLFGVVAAAITFGVSYLDRDSRQRVGLGSAPVIHDVPKP